MLFGGCGMWSIGFYDDGDGGAADVIYRFKTLVYL